MLENELNITPSTPAVVVMDFDDIIVPMSVELYHNVRKNWHIYSRWFADLGELKDSEINDRPFYNFIEWLIMKKYMGLTPHEYSAVILEILANLKKTFFDKNPYDLMEPTKFAKKTLLNPLYIDSENIKHVYIISRNITEAQDINKRKFITENFQNPKISYLNVEYGQRKSSVIKENNISFNMFIDDELVNIRDIVENMDDLERREFVIPKFGYNKMPTDLDVLIEARGAIYNYYNA